MSVALITGAAGLIGSEAARSFAAAGYHVVGVDNDMRSVFFGPEASTRWQRERLIRELAARYEHHDVDIRDHDAIAAIFGKFGADVSVVIHTAAQPSHDWAAREPHTDFSVNATGTLTLLEAARRHSPDATFIFTSTNKVYGDRPNQLPLVELETRWELATEHPYHRGIPEDMPVDQTLHSLFGASKVAADVLVQEYGRYFGMKTACFRGGCLTGPNHAGTELHGFLAYLVKSCATGSRYTVFGYKAKQVRDNIHSADLITAFHAFVREPRVAEVYNVGGGRPSNCSMLEGIRLTEQVVGKELRWTYTDAARVGDHMWWISDLSRFQLHYPEWKLTYDVPAIIREIYEHNRERWRGEARA